MKKILLSATLVASVFASGYEVGAGVGFSDIEKSNRLNNKTDIDVRIGKYLPKNHILRLELERSVAGAGPTLTRTLLNVEHYFKKDKKVQPYAFVGGGYQWAKGNYADRAVADLGVGVKCNIDTKLAAFVEARALRDFRNNDNHYTGILGINYKFGFAPKDSDKDGVNDKIDECPNTPLGVKVDSVGCPIDSDHDGVADYLDKCANTPAGVKVDKNGCPVDSDKDGIADYLDKCANTPAGVKVDKNGCPVDSDKDGVADYLDKCANTPAGVKVDKNGCPIDSDKDGVADYLDKCPNTPAGMKVNKNGCAISYKFNITFATNSATLNPQAQVEVKKFANFLKENPQLKAVIEGYTDNKGPKEYNIKLSEKRAEAVYEELINLGIKADRLSYKGFGPANPVASNDTAEGRAMNRRVIAKIIYK